MRIRILTACAAVGLTILFVAGADSSVYGQGRGGGGRPAGAGPPAGAGVNRGITTSSNRSNGRSDDGFGRASNRSNGRADAGRDRAIAGRGNATIPSDNELRHYTGISKKLDMTPEALRTSFEAALAANPDLRWGQFVAANVIADNMGTRFPGITSAAILTGLQNGDSIGRTLQNLGLGEQQAEDVEKAAKREIKESKKNQ